MSTIFFSTIIMFLWGLVAPPVSIGLAQKFRLLDKPGGRKTHRDITPRGAGIVLWVGYLLWALVAAGHGLEISFIATGASLVFVVGYMDDMHPLPSLVRLIFHIIAAAWVVYPLPVPVWQRVLFVFWITGVTSAYNLIDGMDGLCLTVSLLTMVSALFFLKHTAVWMPISGLVFGVLLWNFPIARTFLGDGGSTLLGYVCASHLAWGIFPNMFRNGIVYMSLALFLIGGVPVLDTLIVMTRRLLKKRSPFSPDRGHGHHKLQDKGLTKLQTLLVLGAFHVAMLVLGFKFMGMKFF